MSVCLDLEQSLVGYLRKQLRHIEAKGPDIYLKTLVILPTRRAVKELKKDLLKTTTAGAVLLPKIMAINDVETLCYEGQRILLSETKRKGLVLKALEELGEPVSAEVADLLMALMDEMNTHEASLDKLADIVPEIYAEHWQVTSAFLKGFYGRWQGILSDHNWIEKSQYAVDILRNLAQEWTKEPPQTPVLLGGIDGFIPAVAALMAAADALPQGQVILNGYLPRLSHEHVLSTHPNALLNSFQNEGQDEVLEEGTGRSLLLSHMMSDQGFEERNFEGLSFEGVRVLESETLAQEAQSIALLARKNLEDPKKITAIITPDQELSEAIQAQLSRWHIRIDSAGGVPLSKGPLGQFVLDVLDLGSPLQEATSFLGVLKSPFAFLGYETPYELKKLVRRFERLALRVRAEKVVDLDEDLRGLMARFDTATSAFFTLKLQETQPFMNWIQGHILVLESLNPTVFEGDGGKEVGECFKELAAHGEAYPCVNLGDYRDILRHALSQKSRREAVNHPRLKILSPIQGAYTAYDQAILCGLNEGVWPQNAKANPWLNRDMKLALGLPDDQILIGRAASLLAQNMTCPEVVLSYAKRRGTEPAAPSRWILRLQALAQKQGQVTAILLKDPLAKWGKLLDEPSHVIALKSPQAIPPKGLRPKRFSVSDMERFFRDPYQIHAKHILKLYPLEELNQSFGMAEFGTWVHAILENYVLQTKPLADLAQAYLPPTLPPETKFLWLRAFEDMKQWVEEYLQTQSTHSLETLVEKKLIYSFDIEGTIYELVGKADRIDRLHDGTYEIVDYKTGTPPSKKDVVSGDAPQLALLAYLFEKNNPHAHVSKLTYVALTGQKINTFDRGNIVSHTVDRLKTTLAHYNDGVAGYEVNPYEALRDPYNPYAHLERTVEWLGGA